MVPRRKSRGLTTIELTVVVAIVGILAAIAFWNLSGVVPAYRLRAAASDVTTQLALTRARAIANNRYYLVRFQANGYQVFEDSNGNGAVDGGEPLSRSFAYGPGVTYTAAPSSPIPGDIVAFDVKGYAFNVSAAGQRIRLQSSAGVKEIRVSYSGQVKKL